MAMAPGCGLWLAGLRDLWMLEVAPLSVMQRQKPSSRCFRDVPAKARVEAGETGAGGKAEAVIRIPSIDTFGGTNQILLP